MIRDLASVARSFGLKIHADKTVVLSTASIRPEKGKCGSCGVKVANCDDTEKYLGRKVCLASYHDTELSHRVACAWASFFKFKDGLCNKLVDKRQRLRLFDAVVTPSVMYGCAAWTLKADSYQRLTMTKKNASLDGSSA